MPDAPVEPLLREGAGEREGLPAAIEMPGWGAWAAHSLVLPWLVPAGYLLDRLFLPLGAWVFLAFLAWTFAAPVYLHWRNLRRAGDLRCEGASGDAARDLGRYTYVTGCSLAFYWLFLFVQPLLGEALARRGRGGYRTYDVEIILGVFVVYATLSAVGYWYLRRAVRRMNLARETLQSTEVAGPVTDADAPRFR